MLKYHLKNYSITVCFWLLTISFGFGQSLPSTRSTDWTLAGLRDTAYPTNLINFSGDPTGVTDNAPTLISLLSGLSQPTIIQFDQGNYLFQSQIEVPENVVIRGKGAGITTFTFTLGGVLSDCFSVSGAEPSTEYALTANALKDDFTLQLNSTAAFAVGDYIRLIKDDAALVFDSWAERRTGQISRISAVTATTITLESPLRMNFITTENPRLRKISLKKNVGFECFTLLRTDQVTLSAERNRASKIRFSCAANCWVKGVESVNSNYAHVEALYSTNLLVTGCYFHDSFEFEDGGRAYGVMLHFATSESRVENTIFKTLRHAMIVQAGANGNVFSYNYTTDAKKTFFGFTFDSEDLVCHGNYPYLNLFEGNVAEWPKVDASHGSNGPYNTFFRNRSTKNAFSVTATSAGNQNNDQNFLGNEGTASLGGANHFEFLNQWQGTSGTLENSLAYSTKPSFLNITQYGSIGYGFFGIAAKNPANLRFDANVFINEICGRYTWDGTSWTNNFEPALNSTFFDLRIDDGALCTISAPTSVNQIIVNPGGRLALQNGTALTLVDSIFLLANDQKYSQFNGDVSLNARWEMVITEPGWHHITAPLATVTLAQIESDITIWYADQPKPSAFYWDPNTAVFQAITNNTFNLGTSAISIFINNLFVRPAKGINQNGNLPVRLIFKGVLKNGNVNNTILGFGTASDVVGPDADGWNFIMNPYPCAINIDDIFSSTPTNYQVGAHVYNPSSSTYEIRTLSSINNGNSTSIAPGQSFFVKLDAGADLNSGFFDFTNAVKTTDTPPFYKTTYEGVTFSIKQNSKQHTGHLFFSEEASKEYDSKTDISARTDTNNLDLIFAFNKEENQVQRFLSQAAFPLNLKDIIIPIAVYSNYEGEITFDIIRNTSNNNFWLEDARSGLLYDFKNSIVTSINKGWNTNRFYLHQVKNDSDIEAIIADINISSYDISINYLRSFSFNAGLRLTDITGRELMPEVNFPANGNHLVRFDTPLKSGVYIIQIREAGIWKSIKMVL